MTAKVACLGAGYFSRFHIEGWSRLDGAVLVGVTDHDLEKAKASGAPAFDDLAVMLDTVRPDILDIVVPPSAHKAAIATALDHGVQTIICQKPFCGDLETATEMAEKAAAQGVTLVVHENFRFQPWYRAIKATMDAGDIGDPLQATFRLRPGDGQGPDAYLARQAYFQTMPRFLVHETGVHYIDTFRYLFGDFASVYAALARDNPAIAGEDAGIIHFQHQSATRSLFDGNRLLDHAAENTRCTMGEGLFEGTQGTLTLLGDGSVHLRQFGASSSKVILPKNTATTFGGDCTYHLQAHVLGHLFENVPLENTASNYLYVMTVEGAVYRSAQTGQRVNLNGQK